VAKLTLERWQRATHVFAEAIEKPAAQRQAFLDEACGTNDVPRADVESMLAAYEAAEAVGFLHEPAAGSCIPQSHLRLVAAAGSDAKSPDDSTWTTRTPCSDPLAPANGVPKKLADAAPLPRATVRADDAALGQTDEYEILEQIGCGGMGRVYKARQIGLDRMVALKTIRMGRLSTPDEIQRFQVEARAAAALQHPNIVPVFDVGQFADGRFYSMEYVDGQTLADRMRAQDNLMGAREVAQLLRQVALAVQYAHERGIIHRDLKPGNILLDRNDIPRITDFGLAKEIENDSSLTATGLILGTPSFMAPEQARGENDKVGPPADVYALGAVLYSLITGRPPFQGANTAETIQQVIHADVVPPHWLNRCVPRDLETISLKCLEKDASKRYASAKDVADELGRFRDNMPIKARPISRAERFRRWCQRNPRVALLSSLATILMLVTICVLFFSYVQVSWHQQRDEASFQQALQTVDDMLTKVSEERLFNVPRLQPLRQELLKLARDHYQGFIRERGEEPGLRDSLARAHYRVGQINNLLGKPNASLKELEQAERIQRELIEQHADTAPVERLLALSDTLTAKASTLAKQGKNDLTVPLFEEAVKLREGVVLREPNQHEYQRKLASSLMNLGIAKKDAGKLDEARSLLEEAQDIRQKLLAKIGKPDFPLLRDLGKGYHNLGTLRDAKHEDAIDNFRKAQRAFEQARDLDQRDLDVRFSLAICVHFEANVRANLASESQKEGDYQAAVAGYDEAERDFTELANDNPDLCEYQAACARVFLDHGSLEAEWKNYARAEELLRSAVQTFEELLSTGIPDYERDYAVARGVVAEVMSQRGAPSGAGL
jgi:serine/threonine protein kinase